MCKALPRVSLRSQRVLHDEEMFFRMGVCRSSRLCGLGGLGKVSDVTSGEGSFCAWRKRAVLSPRAMAQG